MMETEMVCVVGEDYTEVCLKRTKPNPMPSDSGEGEDASEQVETVAGEDKPVLLDTYLVGVELMDTGAEWHAEGNPGADMMQRAKEIFKRHNLPNLSGRMVLELMQKILEKTEEIEKKYGAIEVPK